MITKGQHLSIKEGQSLLESELDLSKRYLDFQITFLKELGIPIDESKEIGLRVKTDYVDYSTFLANCCGINTPSTGLYIPEQDELVVFKNDEFEFTLAHELFHGLTEESRIDDYPWLREGMADLTAAHYWLPNGQISRKSIYDIEELRLNLSQKKLKQFFTATDQEWSQLSALSSYGTAWAIVNYLYYQKPEFFSAFLDLIQNGESVMASFETYDGGFKRFRKEFHRFYRFN